MSRPELLSLQMVNRAMTDPDFRKNCPEFLAVQPSVTPTTKPCPHCQMRKVQQSQSAAFFNTAAKLDAAGLARLKKYFGIQQLMLNARDPVTGAVRLRVV